MLWEQSRAPCGCSVSPGCAPWLCGTAFCSPRAPCSVPEPAGLLSTYQPSQRCAWAHLECVCSDLATMWGSSRALESSAGLEAWTEGRWVTWAPQVTWAPSWAWSCLCRLPKKPTGAHQRWGTCSGAGTLPPWTPAQILPYFINTQCHLSIHPTASSPGICWGCRKEKGKDCGKKSLHELKAFKLIMMLSLWHLVPKQSPVRVHTGQEGELQNLSLCPLGFHIYLVWDKWVHEKKHRKLYLVVRMY